MNLISTISLPRCIPFLTAAIFLAQGCAHRNQKLSPSERRVFQAYEQAAEFAQNRVGDSLVHFRVEQSAASQSGRDRRPGTVSFAGIVLTEEGHLLAPFTIRPETTDRIEAWIGEQSYLARPLKYDESVGMTIMKVEPNLPLTPINMDALKDLRAGEHAVVVIGSDEESEFSRFTFFAICQGVIEGRYRQFSLSPTPNQTRGAPVFNVHGDLVGLASQSNAWALSDLREDLAELLDEAKGRTTGRSPRNENAWFGATLTPINRDYARANDLPRSALWLLSVFEGSPAYDAGFRSGDLVVALNGEPLRLSGSRVYQYFMQALRPRVGAPFSVTAIRDGKEVHGKGVLTLRPEPRTLRAEDLGISVSEINDMLVVQHNLFENQGVLITEVDRGSPAATGRQFGRNLLLPRDVITSLAGRPTPTLAAFGEALDYIRRERPEAVLVEFQRGPTAGLEALNMRIGDRDSASN
ncbi:MAG: hypothetical protein JJU29_17130 [Verrucomicrobia bacterium]|nr:hypothetical protein [Verrucomicrobiota bacterium]MCH8513016.1 PDZ domain-containing protein [Kiritimatiellia bacterium]